MNAIFKTYTCMATILILILITAGSTSKLQAKTTKWYTGTGDDYVPNSETAIKVAEAIWLPIYGKRIYQERPFKAILSKDSTWIVTGTLHVSGNSKYIVGGTAYIEIQKSDCKILKVLHGK